jgi:hypothetical protein
MEIFGRDEGKEKFIGSKDIREATISLLLSVTICTLSSSLRSNFPFPEKHYHVSHFCAFVPVIRSHSKAVLGSGARAHSFLPGSNTTCIPLASQAPVPDTPQKANPFFLCFFVCVSHLWHALLKLYIYTARLSVPKRQRASLMEFF